MGAESCSAAADHSDSEERDPVLRRLALLERLVTNLRVYFSVSYCSVHSFTSVGADGALASLWMESMIELCCVCLTN